MMVDGWLLFPNFYPVKKLKLVVTVSLFDILITI